MGLKAMESLEVLTIKRRSDNLERFLLLIVVRLTPGNLGPQPQRWSGFLSRRCGRPGFWDDDLRRGRWGRVVEEIRFAE